MVFASKAPVARLITAELARNAVDLAWTRDGARYHEGRGITPAAVATRR